MRETKFKQTEIGEIPEDWEVTTLGKLGKFSKGTGISREQSHSGTIPAIRYGEIYTTHHDYIKQFNSFISEEVAKASKRLEYGDLLFSSSGETKEEIGKSVAFVSDFEAYAGGDIIIISPDTKKYYPKFWGFYLNSMQIVKQKALRGQGDAVVHIVSKDLASIIVAHPKPEEQVRIAEALSDVDGLLQELDGVIAKKRAIKQGAMQELLTGKRRLEGFEGEWVEKKFDDFIDRFATGLNPRTNFKLNDGGIFYYVTIKDFMDGRLYFEGCDRIDEKALELINNRSDLRAGDLLFSSIGRVGDAYVIKEKPTNWNINESVFALRPCKDMDPNFLYYLIKSEKVQNTLIENVTGSTLKSIKMGHLKEVVCWYPSDKAEQSAIAKILCDIDADIEALETKRTKYEQLKQGMMQELLTGKIRLV